MRSVKIAKRYAKSLLLLARDNSLVEEVAKDMQMLESVGRENRDFRLLLSSPVVKKDKKIAIIKAIFEKHFQTPSMLFVQLIVKKNRESVLLEIAESYMNQHRAMKGIKEASVITATALTDVQREMVESQLRIWGKGEVNVAYQVDPDIIAGIVVRMEDVEYNGSISSKLQALRQEFSQNPFISKL
ncbi:MAG: ATP synthase F1 subunit delta [Cryomorphaceae bacterium]|nr:ATP synthase F1 subunit delta [Cryomorphaceae bacterium]